MLEPARRKQRAGTVAAVNRDRQAARADCFRLERAREDFEVVRDGVALLDAASDLLLGGFGELGLMKDVEQFVGLHRV